MSYRVSDSSVSQERGLTRQVRIKVREGGLVGIGPQAPVGVKVPVHQVDDLPLALGLQLVVQARSGTTFWLSMESMEL